MVCVFTLPKGRSDYGFCSVSCNFQSTVFPGDLLYRLFLLTAVYILWCGIQTRVDSALLSLMNRYVVSSFLLLSYLLELADSF